MNVIASQIARLQQAMMFLEILATKPTNTLISHIHVFWMLVNAVALIKSYSNYVTMIKNIDKDWLFTLNGNYKLF